MVTKLAPIESRVCRICGQPGEFYSPKLSECKKCYCARLKAWRKANPDKVIRYNSGDVARSGSVETCSICHVPKPIGEFRKRMRHCKECGRLNSRKWKDKNRKHCSEYRNQYNRLHPEKNRAHARAWELANPDRVRERARRGWQMNKEERLAKLRSYRNIAKNKERHNLETAAYKRANPDKRRQLETARKARRFGSGGTGVTVEQWQSILIQFNNSCAYCGAQPKRLTQDHVVALSKGGTHSPENIVPACRSCNARKGTKSATEFMNQLQKEQNYGIQLILR